MALLIGGVSFADQNTALSRGVDVLIATPGRLLDHFERGKVLLNDVKILVIDEADRMLDMGFIPDVEKIVSLLPRMRQTLFFSATLSDDIQQIGSKFVLNPKIIEVAPPASTAETVAQHLIWTDSKSKRQVLRNLLAVEQVKNAVIFCNRKRDISSLVTSLKQHGFSAVALHGDMTQSARLDALQKFKDGYVPLLIASDVAARGLDIVGLSHVFNFDVPMSAGDYVHRIGRTGRAGKLGRAFTIAAGKEDIRYIGAIEKLIGKPIPLSGSDQTYVVSAASNEPSAPDDPQTDPPKQKRKAKPLVPARKPSSPTRKTGTTMMSCHRRLTARAARCEKLAIFQRFLPGDQTIPFLAAYAKAFSITSLKSVDRAAPRICSSARRIWYWRQSLYAPMRVRGNAIRAASCGLRLSISTKHSAINLNPLPSAA